MRPDEQQLAVGLDLAKDLFDKIGRESFDGIGFTRAAYGEGEQKAHDTLTKVAQSLDLDIKIDAALNMCMTLKGRDRDAGALLIGSHLDAVPAGGNYDGLAGVLSGIACVAALRDSGIQPEQDISILAIRSEESAWFGGTAYWQPRIAGYAGRKCPGYSHPS